MKKLVSIVAAVGAIAFAAPAFADEFSGCLGQEKEPPNFYRLENATREGEKLGDVRLTGSLSGIDPKQAMGSGINVQGTFTRASGENDVSKIRVRTASETGESCA